MITRALSPELKSDRVSADLSSGALGEAESLIGGDEKSGGEREVFGDFSDSDDDWEGVESTELDELFNAATSFIAATAADRATVKVQTWQKLGAMPPGEAMEKYSDIMTDLYSTGLLVLPLRKKMKGEVTNSGSHGPMGPVFSSFIYEEESGSEL
ncbi:Acyl-CoA-binding domain-containing protein 2 [Striga hermonthica]|uniref:Acyl-CoA-binding domain-containing protein 2 n=1 Tax=Striga hermonthica TaxID=68872 RepID=A0A9N7MKN8_STRHE|nr:Acyl-CoA-binding domain-containing protein 2 [Striga hermonthica]